MIASATRLESVQEYYFSQKLREVATLKASGKPIINMGIGSPDLPPHPSVITALQSGMAAPNAHQYQSYQGLPELRETMARFYQKNYAVTCNPNNEILPLMGSKEGIMHLSLAFLNKGDKVLIPNPGYPTYASVTKLVEAIPLYYDLKESHDWQPNLTQLEQMDLQGVKLMWLNYPHMPTGANAENSTFEKLIAWAKKRGILLINDNPYSFILNETPKSLLQFPGALEVGLELNSLSKSFNMAGWRVGMLLGNAHYIKEVLKVKSNMDSGMFYGIQKGAIVALQQDASWFESLNATYRKRRDVIEKLATLAGCTPYPHSVGMFVWAKINDASVSSEAFVDILLHKHHLFVAPGTVFGSNGKGYVRFSLCVQEDMIQKAMGRF